VNSNRLSFRILLAPVVAAGALFALVAAVPARAEALVDVGTPVADAKLESVAGGRQALFGKADVHIFLFFKPGQDRSLETMKELAACEKTLATKPVRVVGIVSSSFPKDEVLAFLKQTGATVPVLFDQDDALYGEWQIRQHPIAIVVDRDRKVAALQPYTRLRYCDILMAHVQFLLKEISQEQYALALNPPAAVMPSDDKVAVATRNVNLGNKYLAKGICGLAVQMFDKALALDPANAEALAGKAKCAGGAPAPAAAPVPQAAAPAPAADAAPAAPEAQPTAPDAPSAKAMKPAPKAP
jgi:hypothetical protein